MRVLITGASGYSGKYLIDYIINAERKPDSDNSELFGLYNSSKPRISDNICTFFKVNICNFKEISAVLTLVQPDYIIHLAGSRSGSYENLLSVNAQGTINLIEAAKNTCLDTRILIISSSAVYGYAGDDPISEDTALNPVGAYGVSKAAGEMAALSYFRQFGMNISVVRTFNLIGSGQDSNFVIGKIVKQIFEIRSGIRSSLELYSLDSGRDFVDVRDVTGAYWNIISSSKFEDECAGQIFNVGSGFAFTPRNVISLFEKLTGKKYDVILPPEIGKDLVPTQKSDNQKIKTIIGWLPTLKLEDSLRDMLLFQENR